MLDASLGLIDCTAFDAENNVARSRFADFDQARPIDHALAASAAHRRAGHFAALGFRLFDGNIFGVQVNETVYYMRQPNDRILAAEKTVAGVEVDADRRRIDQPIDPIQTGRSLAVLLMRLQADVVHAGFGPSSVLTTGAPHSAAKRIACLRYSVPISGLQSGVCAERPESLTPAFSQARRMRKGSSSIDTL